MIGGLLLAIIKLPMYFIMINLILASLYFEQMVSLMYLIELKNKAYSLDTKGPF